jgi:hypothetical protein
MSDALAIVARVVSEHHAIRRHVKLTGDTVNEMILKHFSLSREHNLDGVRLQLRP